MSETKTESSSNDSTNSLPLLSGEDDYEYVITPVRGKTRTWWRPWAIHFLILTGYTITFAALAKHFQAQNCHVSMIHTPARSAVQWGKVTSSNNLREGNPYQGPPSPEVDAAWRDLLKNSNIRISGETLRKLNRESIQLSDGSGDYFGGLNAHHHLHCIKSVRRVIYRDYYHIPEDDMLWMHLDHCLEDLRQAVMCNPDLSILTYDWLPNYRKPWANFTVDLECVDWEILDGWAGERAFSLFDQKSLVHPTLGLSWPMINGTIDDDTTTHPKDPDY